MTGPQILAALARNARRLSLLKAKTDATLAERLALWKAGLAQDVSKADMAAKSGVSWERLHAAVTKQPKGDRP